LATWRPLRFKVWVLKQHLCRVIENRVLWADVRLLTFDAPELAAAMRPGQFALLRDPAIFDPYLRRTAWLYRIENERVACTLPARDPLAARTRPGDRLDLLAPLGGAIEFSANARHILLIGEGARVAPLMAVAERAIAQQREVALVSRGADACPAHLLAPEIEYRTDARALGDELIVWADAIVANGSNDLYHLLIDLVRAARYRLEPGWVRGLIDLPMPCGTGACYACAVETRRGIQLACVDGPAFDLAEWASWKTR
jgi:dihydroorotate dehydrogenase electron transfer subunit